MRKIAKRQVNIPDSNS